MENGGLVPIGKYKGQPIEALAQDRQYADWLVARPWFREKYQNLYAVIINNFGDPSETPEHNSLQARFLDEDFRLKFALFVIPRLWWYSRPDSGIANATAACLAGFLDKAEAVCREENSRSYRNGSSRHTVSQIWLAASERENENSNSMVWIGNPRFEQDGVDVLFGVRAGVCCAVKVVYEDSNSWRGKFKTVHSEWVNQRGRRDGIVVPLSIEVDLAIEIKPEIGDDYPAVLRQMRRNGSRILFTRSYGGSGVSESTFLEFMESQGIRVAFERDVDSSGPVLTECLNEPAFIQSVLSRVLFQ